jgi:hypothetical protein
VGNVLTVAVLDCNNDLLENSPGLLLIKLLVDHLFEIGVQAASRDVFHHEIHMRVCLKGLN